MTLPGSGAMIMAEAESLDDLYDGCLSHTEGSMKKPGMAATLRRWMTTLLPDDVQSGGATGPVEGGAANAANLTRDGHEAQRARGDGVAPLNRRFPARSELQRRGWGPGSSAL
jgi:hypothetical protein